MRIVRDSVVIYLGLLTVMFSLQTRIIFPGASTQGQPFAEVRPRPGTELVRLETEHGERVVALFGPALTADGRPDPARRIRPTLIYFYGNAMCLSYAAARLRAIPPAGPERADPRIRRLRHERRQPLREGMPGHGRCGLRLPGLDSTSRPQTIIAAGWSLGGAVAIDLASRRRVGGLIVFSSFTSGVDMARRMLPFVPVSLLLRHRFDSMHKIAKIPCPILIGHGRRDRIVPFEMGEKLAATAGGPVTTLWIDEADHNDFFDVGGRRIDEAITRFVQGYVQGPTPPHNSRTL